MSIKEVLNVFVLPMAHPSPRGKIFPVPVPVKAGGGPSLPIPEPERGMHPRRGPRLRVISLKKITQINNLEEEMFIIGTS